MSLQRSLRSLLRRLPFVPRRRRYRISWLTTQLAVSRAPNPRDWRVIRAAGIAAVVDLRAEAEEVSSLAHAGGLEYLRLPIEEHTAPTEAELQGVANWICERLAAGRPVLVHCRAGLGRSPLVACAALVRHGLSLEAASAMLKQGRPQAHLTEAQDALLTTFALHHSRAGVEPHSLTTREGAAGDS